MVDCIQVGKRTVEVLKASEADILTGKEIIKRTKKKFGVTYTIQQLTSSLEPQFQPHSLPIFKVKTAGKVGYLYLDERMVSKLLEKINVLGFKIKLSVS